uniref:Uncharacterized protein n=1 Tax=Amphimedon queenslandica TaxID=400682 RepID=A0A1X7TEY7_AMPQE
MSCLCWCSKGSAGAGGITGATVRAPPGGTARAFPGETARAPPGETTRVPPGGIAGAPSGRIARALHEGLQPNLLQQGKWDLLHLLLFLFQPDQGLVIYLYYKENDTYIHKVFKLEVL